MSNVPASLFYFEHADSLEGFHGFEVIQTFQTQGSDSVPMWSVSGYDRLTGQNTMLADFHARGMADTFCDMCTIISVR